MTSDRFKEKEDEKPERLVEPTQAKSAEDNLEIAPDHKDRIGTLVGKHYEILELIGVGGMSTVYKARHTLLDRPVTLKIILPKLVSDKNTIMRFEQEAKAATSLNHTNICNVSEYGLGDDGIPYIAMDYVEGSSLEDLIKTNGIISVDRALAIIEEVSIGLYHAHSNGIIHRDVKPANILIVKNSDGTDSVRIVDFGIAKIIREDESGPNLTKTGEIFGTPNYMSPEQCLGKSVDTRSDIYSVGCILFHMLTGRAPFESESTLKTLMSHLNESIDSISGIPQAVNQIVQKCMSKNPDDRYSSLQVLIADIERFKEGKTLETQSYNVEKKNASIAQLVGYAIIILAVIIIFQSTRIDTKNANSDQKLPGESVSIHQIQNDKTDKVFEDIEKSTVPTKLESEKVPQDIQSALSKNSQWLWKQKHHEGDLAHRSGNTEKAYDLYQEAIRTAISERASQKDLRFLYEELGGCALYLDKKDEATKAFYKAAAYSQYLGDKEKLIANLKALANTEMAMNRFGNAISHFEKVIKTKGNSTDNSPALMEDWLALGEAYQEAGQYRNAKRSLENVFRIAKQNPGKNIKAVAFSHWVVAKAEKKLGNLNLFKKHMNLSLKNGRQAGLSKSVLKQIKSESEI